MQEKMKTLQKDKKLVKVKKKNVMYILFRHADDF